MPELSIQQNKNAVKVVQPFKAKVKPVLYLLNVLLRKSQSFVFGKKTNFGICTEHGADCLCRHFVFFIAFLHPTSHLRSGELASRIFQTWTWSILVFTICSGIKVQSVVVPALYSSGPCGLKIPPHSSSSNNRRCSSSIHPRGRDVEGRNVCWIPSRFRSRVAFSFHGPGNCFIILKHFFPSRRFSQRNEEES